MCLANRQGVKGMRLAVFAFLCVLFLLLNREVACAADDSGTCGNKLTWELTDGVLTISGTGEMLDYSDGAFPGWFNTRKEIYEVVLPEGLTTVGDFAFLGCENLTKIRIPSAVTKIGQYAFAQCFSLRQLELNERVQVIGEGAFQECEALAAVTFPESLSEIGAKAFYRCYSLQTLTIPATVKNVGASAFAYCTGLVRATVNAHLNELPEWTFYGCDKLVDVSLAPSIVEVGEFAFKNCANLRGVYTQTGSIDTAFQLEQSIAKGDETAPGGIVATYDMPEFSVAVMDDGQVSRETKVTQLEETVVSVERATDYSGDRRTTKTIVSAAVDQKEDWEQILRITEETIAEGAPLPLIVELQLTDMNMSGEQLTAFAGRPVVLQIVTENGVIWKIDMAQMEEVKFAENYDLSVKMVEKAEAEEGIESSQMWQISFADNIDFDATLGFRKGKMHDLATFYVKDGKDYSEVETIVVDSGGYAWFALANVEKKQAYCLALNEGGHTLENAVIPSTMYDQYGLDEEATLMDADGVRYRITGRSSRWGITLGQFMSYVLIAVIAVVIVVGSIMLAIYITKRSKEKYEQMAREAERREKEEEEALRLQIMKELLGETAKKE